MLKDKNKLQVSATYTCPTIENLYGEYVSCLEEGDITVLLTY